MTRHITDRFAFAILLSVAGALIAVLAGQPEAALLTAPWLVLSVLGLTQLSEPQVKLAVRPLEDRVIAGDTIDLVTTLTSTESGLAKVMHEPAERFWPGTVARADRQLPPMVEAVQAGRPVEIERRLIASEWGTHDLGRTTVEITHAYGLLRSTGVVSRPAVVRVHPTTVQLREVLTPWMVRKVSGTHRSRDSARGVEYADLRPYGPGDSPRDINWRASARSADLWVSQRHPDRATDVVLLLDSFVESGHDVRSVFGLAVEAAVALSESHLNATDRVGLIEFGGLIRWVTPSTGRVQLQRLTDALLATGLYANAADRELPILPPRTLPPRSFVIALTPLLDERFIDAVFQARGRGHDVAVIECVSFEGDDDTERDFERVTLQLWRAERAMLRDRMAEQGIAVARWHDGDHLDIALGELLRRRRRAVRVRGR